MLSPKPAAISADFDVEINALGGRVLSKAWANISMLEPRALKPLLNIVLGGRASPLNVKTAIFAATLRNELRTNAAIPPLNRSIGSIAGVVSVVSPCSIMFPAIMNSAVVFG